MRDGDKSIVMALRALSNPRRLTIVRWLADPASHFPPQRDGDLVEDRRLHFDDLELGNVAPEFIEALDRPRGHDLVQVSFCDSVVLLQDIGVFVDVKQAQW